MASSNRYQKRASVAPDTKLPPITETPPASSPTSQSPKGAKSRNDNENPFRRNSRRPSLALSSSSGSSQDSTTSPTSRRSSSNAPGRNSIDLSKSENIIKQVEKQRRGSVLNVMPNGRKASFRTIGARVTTLLKAKNAFARLKNRQGIVTDELNEEDSKAFEIEKMPNTPRFASTLSAEAQYAMMKGYEDVVYSNLCIQYPEYRPMLRRNRTPHSGITVSPPKGKDSHHRLRETSTTSGKLEDVVDGKANDANVSEMESEQPTTSTPTPEDKSDQTPRDTLTTSPVPRSLSSLSHSPREAENTSFVMRSPSKHKHVKRHVDRPDKEQQLVMTYRYQRAMDILDNIRMHQGWHALSPRMKAEHRIEPLKEYNSWSYVWNHEFVPKPGVAKM